MFGLMMGSLFLTNLSDKFGRKPVLMVVTLVSGVIIVPILYCQTDFKTTLVLTFLFGATASCRYSVSYMYTCELSTSVNSNFYGMLCMVGDAFSSIILGVYFIFFKNIDQSIYFMLITQTIGVYILWKHVPESPKFLFETNRKQDFLNCIERMA